MYSICTRGTYNGRRSGICYAIATVRVLNDYLTSHTLRCPLSSPFSTHSLLPQRRTIDVTPDSDPVSVCSSYNQQLNGTWECSCDIQPDNSVGVECLELESKCNADSSLCYLLNVKVGLTPQSNQVISLESCTTYVDLNLTRFEGSSTKLANYSDIVPCVKVDPVAPNDFSSLAGCSVTVNGAPCQTCEICTDKAPALGITLDCCNTNPEGEQLKVDCGAVGGGGAYVPIFETYEEGSMETCSSGAYAVVFGRLTFVGLLAMTALAGVV